MPLLLQPKLICLFLNLIYLLTTCFFSLSPFFHSTLLYSILCVYLIFDFTAVLVPYQRRRGEIALLSPPTTTSPPSSTSTSTSTSTSLSSTPFLPPSLPLIPFHPLPPIIPSSPFRPLQPIPFYPLSPTTFPIALGLALIVYTYMTCTCT